MTAVNIIRFTTRKKPEKEILPLSKQAVTRNSRSRFINSFQTHLSDERCRCSIAPSAFSCVAGPIPRKVEACNPEQPILNHTNHFMKKFIWIAGAMAALSFTSCKKDDSTETGGGGTTTKLLKKITTTENGETTVYTLTYDANKRLASMTSADNQESTLLSYDAAGNLIKVEEKEDNFKNIYVYTYSNNVPVSATFKSWQQTAGEPDDLIEDDVLTYTVSGGQVTKIHLEMTQAGESEDFNLTYTNGNLTKVEAATPGLYTATFGYGSKKPIFPQISKYVLDQAGFSLQFFAKNEITSIGFDFPGTILDRTVSTQYTYDSNGYVLTSNDGEMQMQFEYQ